MSLIFRYYFVVYFSLLCVFFFFFFFFFICFFLFFFFSSRRRHTRSLRDWSSDVCSSDLLARQNLATHDLRFQREADFLDRVGVRAAFGAHAQLDKHLLPDIVDGVGTIAFLLDLERRAQVVLGELGDTRNQRLVLRGLLPVPGFRARLVDELVDRLDHLLHLLVAEYHGAEHYVFGQFLRFRFHHQHRLLGARHDQVELGGIGSEGTVRRRNARL